MTKEEVTPPSRLYKYRSVLPASRDFTEAIFRTNKVWYSRASAFNDPFDCDHFIDVDRSLEEWQQIMEGFGERFTAGVTFAVGKLFQSLYNRFAEHLNETAEARSQPQRLNPISDERLSAFSHRMGEEAEFTSGGRRPGEIADEAGPDRLNRFLDQYLQEAKNALDARFGVFSLATDPANILMWSHYSDDHAGICIEFDTESQPGAFPNLHPVRYSEESPVIEKRFANILMNLKDKDPSMDEGFLARLARDDVDAEWTDHEIRVWFLTKSLLWAYEREWRSVVPGPGLKKIPAATISGVVLGHKATDEVEVMVRSWVRRRRRKVTISRATKRKGAFALDLVPI
mgnify:FL=1|jgi:hypothetical protein